MRRLQDLIKSIFLECKRSLSSSLYLSLYIPSLERIGFLKIIGFKKIIGWPLKWGKSRLAVNKRNFHQAKSWETIFFAGKKKELKKILKHFLEKHNLFSTRGRDFIEAEITMLVNS